MTTQPGNATAEILRLTAPRQIDLDTVYLYIEQIMRKADLMKMATTSTENIYIYKAILDTIIRDSQDFLKIIDGKIKISEPPKVIPKENIPKPMPKSWSLIEQEDEEFGRIRMEISKINEKINNEIKYEKNLIYFQLTTCQLVKHLKSKDYVDDVLKIVLYPHGEKDQSVSQTVYHNRKTDSLVIPVKNKLLDYKIDNKTRVLEYKVKTQYKYILYKYITPEKCLREYNDLYKKLFPQDEPKKEENVLEEQTKHENVEKSK